jgi:hypothetical protein
MSAAGTIAMAAAYFWLFLAWGCAVLGVALLKQHLSRQHQVWLVAFASLATILLGIYETAHFEEPLTKEAVVEEVQKLLTKDQNKEVTIPAYQPKKREDIPTFMRVGPSGRVDSLKMDGVKIYGVPNNFDIQGELKNADIKDFVSVSGNTENDSSHVEKMEIHMPPAPKQKKIGHIQPLGFSGGSRNADGTFTRTDEFEIDNGMVLSFLEIGLTGNGLISYKILKDGNAVSAEDSISNGFKVKRISNASGRYAIVSTISKKEEILKMSFDEPIGK